MYAAYTFFPVIAPNVCCIHFKLAYPPPVGRGIGI
nr:MAG TPA: hypothetical protein [Caudoviricetes sp.]